MLWLLHACLRGARRSPNVFAFVCGCLMILVAPTCGILAAINDEAARRGTLGTRSSVTILIEDVGGWMLEAIGYCVNSGVGKISVTAVIVFGSTLAMMGVTLTLRPHGN